MGKMAADPVVLVILFILAIIGISMNSLAVVAVSVALTFLMARDFMVHFILALAVMYGLRFVVADAQVWGALCIAVAALTIALAGRPRRREEEEIPPEMIPYLLAMMGGRR